MGVPVSAFSEKLFLKGDGSKFGTVSTDTTKFGVIKTFYPDANQQQSRLIPLAALPAFLLSGDERTIQQVDIPSELSERIWREDLFVD